MIIRFSHFCRRYRAELMLVFLVLIHLCWFSRLYLDWWFEDDVNHIAYVGLNPDPVDYFTSKKTIHNFSFGRTLTPMLPLSFWIDQRMAPRSETFAYFHTILALLFTVLLMYRVLKPYLTAKGALAASGLWLFLPSTFAVVEFLAARHYLEGLMWSLAALLCARRAQVLVPEDGALLHAWKSLSWTLLAGLCFFAAACCKELYVTSTFLLLIAFFGKAKNYRAMALIFAMGGLYAAYRIWAIGLNGSGLGAEWASFRNLRLFFARWPYILTGNRGGYVLIAALLAVLAILLVQNRAYWKTLGWAALHLGIAFITIFPVSIHLAASYQQHGTWHRVAFLFNTMALIGACWLVYKAHHKYTAQALCLLSCIFLLEGAHTTTQKWDVQKNMYRQEAAFYLANPDKLLYSTLPAPWFILGVQMAYNKHQPAHFITPTMFRDQVPEMLRRFPTLWRRIGDDYQPDPALRGVILQNYWDGVKPLHKPIEPGQARILIDPATAPELIDSIDFKDNVLTLATDAGDRIPLPLPENAKDNHFFFSNNLGKDHLLLVNDHPQSNSVRVQALDKDGAQLAEYRWRLEAYGVTARALPGLLNEDRITVRVLVVSEYPIRAGLLRRPNRASYILDSSTSPVSGQSLWLVHVPERTDFWRTRLRVCNPGDRDEELRLTLFRPDLPPETSVYPIGPRGFLEIEAPFQKKPMPVAGQIARSSPELIVRQLLTAADAPGETSNPLANELSTGFRILPEDRAVGLALLNPGPDPATAIMYLDGQKHRQLKLDPRSRTVIPVATYREIVIEANAPLAGIMIIPLTDGRYQAQQLPNRQVDNDAGHFRIWAKNAPH